MIREIGKMMDIHFDDEGPTRIHQLTGGHPYLTRQYTSFIWTKEGKPNQIGLPSVENHISRFVQYATNIFKEIVINSLHERFPQEYDLLKIIAALKPALSDFGSEDFEALNHLQGYGLVEEVDGCYQIRIQVLSSWLNQLKG